MSSNKLIYDCDYTYYKNQANKNKLEYLLSPDKYSNFSQKFVDRGIVGGTNVNINETNLVDIESELKNINRVASKSAYDGYPDTNYKEVKTILVNDGVSSGKNLESSSMFDFSNLLLPENNK